MGKEPKVTTLQKICLGEEVNISIKLLQLGFCELQKIDSENDFYHLPFLLLSSGFERLIKCIICFKFLKNEGRFPTLKEVKGSSNGHNLLYLKNKVINECISEKTATKRPATKADYNFISKDEDLNRIINILSEFGQYARYHNFNIVMGSKPLVQSAKDKWEEYEIEILKEDNLLSTYIKGNKLDEAYEKINRKIISRLEKFARVLTRQFTLGNLGEEAKIYTGVISPFLYLRDEQIGKIDYCNK